MIGNLFMWTLEKVFQDGKGEGESEEVPGGEVVHERLQPFTGAFVDAENLEAGEIGSRGEEVVAMDEDGGGLAFQEKFGFQSLGAGIELEIKEITVDVFKAHVPGETDAFGEKPVFHDGRFSALISGTDT